MSGGGHGREVLKNCLGFVQVKSVIEGVGLKDVRLITFESFKDDRGSFTEIYNRRDLDPVLDGLGFVQINELVTGPNTFRGMHFQHVPYAQGKMIRCLSGSVIDVFFDLRAKSSTFGKLGTMNLSDKLNSWLWVPPGFAHGIHSVTESRVQYMCTDFHAPEYEGVLSPEVHGYRHFFDGFTVVSDKDRKGCSLEEAAYEVGRKLR